jgi:hypothetical protein
MIVRKVPMTARAAALAITSARAHPQNASSVSPEASG